MEERSPPMPKCTKCHQEKSADSFYKNHRLKSGLTYACKECTKSQVKANRLANLDRIREYDRERAKQPHRIRNAVEATRRWRAEDSRRSKAHVAVARAIRNGTIEKSPCCRCNSDNSYAHHESYDHPLVVVWLCQPCHKQRHKEMAIFGIEP